jgi:transcriptional regulator with XRE-family HTH domain
MAGKKSNPEQISAQGRKPQTRDELAKVAGVSHDTISKVEKIEASPVVELSRMTRTGQVSINAAVAVARLPVE